MNGLRFYLIEAQRDKRIEKAVRHFKDAQYVREIRNDIDGYFFFLFKKKFIVKNSKLLSLTYRL